MLEYMSIHPPLVWFCIWENRMISPKSILRKLRRKLSHKNALAKWVHQHKMQNVDTSDDERKVDQEYQKFKRKQNQVSSICDKKIQEFEEQDYLSLKGSKSVSDPNNEQEIKVQYVKPIGGNTLPPQYSKEISRYQPSEKERKSKGHERCFKCSQRVYF